MLPIRQAVDNRHAGILRQFDHMRVGKDARHDTVHIARENARHVGNTLTLPQPDLIRRQVERLPAKVQHPHIERNARTQRWLLENHPKRFILEDGLVAAFAPFCLQFFRRVEILLEFSRREIGNCEKIFHESLQCLIFRLETNYKV